MELSVSRMVKDGNNSHISARKPDFHTRFSSFFSWNEHDERIDISYPGKFITGIWYIPAKFSNNDRMTYVRKKYISHHYLQNV